MEDLLPTLTPLLLMLLMLVVIVSDGARYIIPNWLNAALIVLYAAWVLLAPIEIDWLSGLLMAGVLLLTGFGLFAIGFIGAGDAKLLMALGLFLGWSRVGAEFLIHMGLIGGLLAVVLVTLRRIYKYKETKPTILTAGAPVPYGIAIALSFLMVLFLGKLPGMVALGELI